MDQDAQSGRSHGADVPRPNAGRVGARTVGHLLARLLVRDWRRSRRARVVRAATRRSPANCPAISPMRTPSARRCSGGRRPISSGRRARASSIAIVSRSTARSIPRFRSSPTSTSGLGVGSREGIAVAAEPLLTFRVHDASISAAIRRDPHRGFRANLQQLRRWLQFARAPGFENIRRVAAALSPAVDLEEHLRLSAFDVRWGAIDARYRTRDPWPLAQWDAFVAAEPEMQTVQREVDAALPFSARVRQFIKRRL